MLWKVKKFVLCLENITARKLRVKSYHIFYYLWVWPYYGFYFRQNKLSFPIVELVVGMVGFVESVSLSDFFKKYIFIRKHRKEDSLLFLNLLKIF